MLKRKDHYQVFYALLIILFLITQVFKSVYANQQEVQDRSVDEAALSIQLNAIATVQNHLKKPKNKAQEQRLLIKLAEYFIEKSALEFRISFGATQAAKKKKFLSDYQNSLKTSTQYLSTLIQHNPSFEDLDQAYYMRAKAYQDLEMNLLSEKDYLVVIKNYPQSKYALPSYMSLGEFAVERTEHERALGFFKAVEAQPASPYYPFALFKSAWAHYNLKNSDASLKYLERHLKFYQDKEARDKGLTVSDFATKENTLLDMALFYFEAIENKSSQFPAEQALTYFTQFDRGDILGKMSARFAKLLRTREYNKELIIFKMAFLEKFPQNPSTLTIVMTAFEHFIHRRLWNDALATSKDFVQLYKKFPAIVSKNESYIEAQELLLKTADDLRKVTLKNQNATKIQELTTVLAGLYESFTLFVPEQDPRIPGAYYNLAETLFSIKDFEKAKTNYRWIVDNKKRINPKLIQIHDVELKAIASAYEVLKTKKVIALEVKAKALNPTAFTQNQENLPPEFSQWLVWLDQYQTSYATLKYKEFEAFYFEGIRSLYRFESYQNALTRLKAFVEKYPQSEFTQAASTLVLDTYTLSMDWKNSHNYANRLRKSQIFQKSEFDKKLYEIASTSYFKIAEDAFSKKNYSVTLEICEDHLKKYPASPVASECLFISSQSAVYLEKEALSQKLLSELIQNYTKSRHYLSAFYQRGKIYESQYVYSKAYDDLYFYYSHKSNDLKEPLTPEKMEALKKTLLTLLAYNNNTQKLNELVSSESFCDKKIFDECQSLYSLSLLESPTLSLNKNFFEEFKKQKNNNLKLTYAVIALKHQKNLSAGQTQEILRSLTKNYKEADLFTQNTLTYYLNDSVAGFYRSLRNAITPKGSLKAQESSISSRIKRIEELENLATQLVTLPWKKLQIDILSETAQLYFDFASELERLSSAGTSTPPESQSELKGLVAPFVQKGLVINKKALEIAQTVIIEKTIRDRLEEIQNRNLASIASDDTKKEPTQKIVLPLTLIPDINFFDKMAASLSLKSLSKSPMEFEKEKEKEFLISQMLVASKEKRFYLAKHFLDVLDTKKILKENESLVLKSYYLAETGASAEAFYELSKNISVLEKESKTYMTLSLAAYYTYTQDESAATEWLKKFVSISEGEQKFYSRYSRSAQENFLIAFGIVHYQIKHNPSYFHDLLTSVKAYGSKEQSEWAQSLLNTQPAQTASL